jgi:two-component system chemotaxis sensor kinase CheA
VTDELLAQFLIEAPELLQRASDDLLALERSPQSREPLEGAFRAVHTLKGSVDLFDFAPMNRVLHAAEDALGRVRDGRLTAGSAVIDAVIGAVNETERWIAAIAATGVMPADQDRIAGRHIAALAAVAGDFAVADASAEDTTWVADLMRRLSPDRPSGSDALVAVQYTPREGSYFAGDDPIAIAKAAPGIEAFFVGLSNPPALDRYDPFACNLTIQLLSAAPLEEVRAAFRFVPDQVRIAAAEPRPMDVGVSAETRPAVVADQFVRVSSDRIERIATLVDDLVVVKNTIGELTSKAAAERDMGALIEGLTARRAELDRLVGQLHQQVVGLRLVPVAPSLRRLPRLVREIASGLGKTVDVTVEDNGVTADKSIVDGLFEPLVHILRNAVDHGVEPEDVRRERGKPAHGAVWISARRVANHLVVEVADDGRGVDPAAVRVVAERRGLLTSAALAALDDQAAIDLIFMPGFSTAIEVTLVSGRGVGMDAVRASVAKLGGVVSISSRAGSGATVTIALPLNAVMTKILVVERGGELYGLPLDRVLETVLVSSDRIAPIRAGRAFVLRDRATPLLDLGELIGGPPCDWRRPSHKAIVVRTKEGAAAVRVDAVLDRMETVMRPLSGMMAGMLGMLGATLLGDGRIMLVLDLEELIG